MNLESWFKEQQQRLAIVAREVGLSHVTDWQLVEEKGESRYIGHISGNYHRGVFLEATEVGRDGIVERFMIAPIPVPGKEEIYGVALLARYNGRYLVQAKSEPGNDTPGHVQLTSTIQASHINITEGRSGKIAFTELYDHPSCRQYIVSQDGAQLYMKRNKVCFIELSEEPEEIPDTFKWATLEEIENLADQGLVSEHVMQCLGVSVFANSL